MAEEPSTSLREVVAEAAAEQLRAVLDDPGQEDRRRTMVIAAELANVMIPGVAVMERAAEHARNYEGPLPTIAYTEDWRTSKLEELRELLAASDDPMSIGATAARLAWLTLTDEVMHKADFRAEHVHRNADDLHTAEPGTIRWAYAHSRSLAYLNPPTNTRLSYANNVLRKVHEAVAFKHAMQGRGAAEFAQRNLASALATPKGSTPEQQRLHTLVRDLHNAEQGRRTADAAKAASGLTELLQQAAATLQPYPTVGEALKGAGRKSGPGIPKSATRPFDDRHDRHDRHDHRGPRPRGK